MTPKEALLLYVKEMDLLFTEEDIEDVSGELYIGDEARAYEIEIDS